MHIRIDPKSEHANIYTCRLYKILPVTLKTTGITYKQVLKFYITFVRPGPSVCCPDVASWHHPDTLRQNRKGGVSFNANWSRVELWARPWKKLVCELCMQGGRAYAWALHTQSMAAWPLNTACRLRSSTTLPWQCWKSKIQALPQVIGFSPEAREFCRPISAKSVFRQPGFPWNYPTGSRYHGVAMAEPVPVPAITPRFLFSALLNLLWTASYFRLIVSNLLSLHVQLPQTKAAFPAPKYCDTSPSEGSSAAGSADVNKISAEKAVLKERVCLAGVNKENARYLVVIRGKAVWTWSVFRSARKSKHWRVSVGHSMLNYNLRNSLCVSQSVCLKELLMLKSFIAVNWPACKYWPN